LKSVHEILDNVYGSVQQKVRVVGGSHKLDVFQKSRFYAGCIYRSIQAAGFYDKVQMRTERTHPKEHFYYISHAKHLVVPASRYSKLMGPFAQNRRGKIVGRSFGVNWRR
jgi:hypothetical protein